MCKPFYKYRLAKIDTSRFVKKKEDSIYLFTTSFCLATYLFGLYVTTSNFSQQ